MRRHVATKKIPPSEVLLFRYNRKRWHRAHIVKEGRHSDKAAGRRNHHRNKAAARHRGGDRRRRSRKRSGRRHHPRHQAGVGRPYGAGVPRSGCLRRSPVEFRRAFRPRRRTPRAEARRQPVGVQNAVATYASIPAGMGLRNGGFFTLGLTLKRCGLNDNEIMGHLSAADTDGSRRKKNAIDSVMKSLKSAKWAS